MKTLISVALISLSMFGLAACKKTDLSGALDHDEVDVASAQADAGDADGDDLEAAAATVEPDDDRDDLFSYVNTHTCDGLAEVGYRAGTPAVRWLVRAIGIVNGVKGQPIAGLTKNGQGCADHDTLSVVRAPRNWVGVEKISVCDDPFGFYTLSGTAQTNPTANIIRPNMEGQLHMYACRVKLRDEFVFGARSCPNSRIATTYECLGTTPIGINRVDGNNHNYTWASVEPTGVNLKGFMCNKIVPKQVCIAPGTEVSQFIPIQR